MVHGNAMTADERDKLEKALELLSDVSETLAEVGRIAPRVRVPLDRASGELATAQRQVWRELQG